MAEELRIGIVYPELLGTYGDRGNAEVLAWRLRRRGYPAVVVDLPAREAIPADLDAYILGGGEDMAQSTASELLRSPDGAGLAEALADDAPALAVCGSLQLLGTTYVDGSGEAVAGLGLVDLETRAAAPRFVGEVVAEGPGGVVLTGFENHGGRTRLGPGVEPLGRVRLGGGNNGEDQTEGFRRGNLVGTYLHGPALARNPALADLFVAAVLARGGAGPALGEIQDDPGVALHAARLAAAGFDASGRRVGRPVPTPL